MASLWCGAIAATVSTDFSTRLLMCHTMPVSSRTCQVCLLTICCCSFMTCVFGHFAENKAVGVMKPGHVFTIEPMICEGKFIHLLSTCCLLVCLIDAFVSLNVMWHLRWLARWDMARRLDGGDQRWQTLSSVRTHPAGNRDRLWDPHTTPWGKWPRLFLEPNVMHRLNTQRTLWTQMIPSTHISIRGTTSRAQCYNWLFFFKLNIMVPQIKWKYLNVSFIKCGSLY